MPTLTNGDRTVEVTKHELMTIAHAVDELRRLARREMREPSKVQAFLNWADELDSLRCRLAEG